MEENGGERETGGAFCNTESVPAPALRSVGQGKGFVLP